MKRMWSILAAVLVLGACDEDDVIVVVDDEFPAPPRFVEASYSNFAVRVTWELDAGWDGDFFRVYSRRVGQGSFTSIAEVTSCIDGFCEYTDINIAENSSYEYFVASVDPSSLLETDSDDVVVVDVPSFTAPPVPGAFEVVALDNANYLRWDTGAREAVDFSFYRVYLLDDGPLLLGETDSEGFVDFLARNGGTFRYAVASVDIYGHESVLSGSAEGTPRPDFTGELVVDFGADAAVSGFRFQEAEDLNPIVDGLSASRHFRFEVDAFGSWIVPGPDAEIFPTGVFTTALKCGVGSDVGCVDWTRAPSTGYDFTDVAVTPEFTYMLRVIGDDGLVHYGSIRVALLGVDQNGSEIMVFDWSYQLQPNNPDLAPGR